jgi:hypothetical protein
MEFQDTIDYVLEHNDSIGVARGVEDSWEVYDRESFGEYIGAITQEGIDFLRGKGIRIYGQTKDNA